VLDATPQLQNRSMTTAVDFCQHNNSLSALRVTITVSKRLHFKTREWNWRWDEL